MNSIQVEVLCYVSYCCVVCSIGVKSLIDLMELEKKENGFSFLLFVYLIIIYKAQESTIPNMIRHETPIAIPPTKSA